MSQNIIDLSWDLAKFEAEKQKLIAGMQEVYTKASSFTELKIAPGSTGGYTELIAKTKEFNSAKSDQINLQKKQEQLDQARLRTLKLQADADAAQLRATLAQEKAEQQRLKTQQAQIDLTKKQTAANEQAATSAKGTYDVANVPFVINSPDTSELKNASVLVNDLDKAQADAAMSAAEMGNSVSKSTTALNENADVAKSAVAADKELESAKLSLNKANSEQNVVLQGYKVQTATANKAAKEQAKVTLDMLTPYELLNKQYIEAQMNAKNLAVQYGVESVEAKEAAATAFQLSTELKTIDNSVGQNQRNVGNYISGTANLNKQFSNFTNIASLAGTALSRLRRQFVGFFVSGLTANLIFPLISAITEWISSLNLAGDAIDRVKNRMQDLNDVYADADKNAGKEITDLKLLYEGSRDVKLSTEERVKAVKKLQDTYPETFKNYTTEQILLGEATKGYDALAASILKTALASAARTKIEALAAQKLDVEFEKQKIENNLARKNLEARDVTTNSGGAGAAMGTGGTSFTNTRLNQIAVNNKKAQADLKAQDDLGAALDDQIKFLTDFAGQQELEKSVIDGNEKKGRKASKRPELESTRNMLDAEFELYKIAQERKLKLLDDEVNDTKRSLMERVNLAEQYKTAQIELSDKTAEHEIKADKEKLKVLQDNFKKVKGTEKNNIAVEIDNATKEIQIAQAKQNDARLSAEDAFNQKYKQIVKDTEEQRVKAFKDAEDAIKNVREEQQSAIDADNATKHGALDKLLKEGVITQEEHDKRTKAADNQNKIDSLTSQLQAAKAKQNLEQLKLNSGMGSPEDLNKATNEVTTITGKLESAQNVDPTVSKKKELAAEEIKIAESVQNAIVGLVDIGYQKQIEAIQRIIDLNNYRKAQEEKAIQESTLSNQEKAARMVLLDNTVAANNRRLEREKAQIQIKQAKFDRDAAVLSIMENAAIALISMPAKLGPLGIAEGIAIAAAAAGQIAMLLAKPLPQMPTYAKGTDFHPGGPALVGEGSHSELVIEPGGKSFVASKPMLLNAMPRGSKVIPLNDPIDSINHTMNNSMMIKTAAMLQAKEDSNHNEKILEAIQEGSRLTVQALRKQKTPHVTFISTGAWQEYIQKNVRE